MQNLIHNNSNLRGKNRASFPSREFIKSQAANRPTDNNRRYKRLTLNRKRKKRNSSTLHYDYDTNYSAFSNQSPTTTTSTTATSTTTTIIRHDMYYGSQEISSAENLTNSQLITRSLSIARVARGGDIPYEYARELVVLVGIMFSRAGLTRDDITCHLKIKRYSASCSGAMSRNLDQLSCTICLDEYEDNDIIGTLECGHEYHRDCLTDWLLVNNVCPLCRSTALHLPHNH